MSSGSHNLIGIAEPDIPSQASDSSGRVEPNMTLTTNSQSHNEEQRRALLRDIVQACLRQLESGTESQEKS